MALLWLEGFDNYGVSGMTGTALEDAIQLRAPGSLIYSSEPGEVSRLGDGYGGGLGLELGGVWPSLYVEVELTSSADWVVGLAFKATVINTTDVIEFAASPGAGAQNYLEISPGGQLSAWQGSGNLLGYADKIIRPNTWYYLEYRLNASTTPDEGEVEIRLNGETVLLAPGTGGGTVATSNPTTIRVRGVYVEVALRRGPIDDIYIADGTEFLGPLKVITLRPSGDMTIDWAPSTGTTNYNLLNETPENQATYVYSGTANDSDLYSIDDLAASVVDVKGIQVEVQAKLAANGSESLQVQCESDSVQASQLFTVDTINFASYSTILENDPATVAPWLPTAIDALQVGIKNGS